MSSVHARYRDRLTQLTRPTALSDHVAPLVAAVAGWTRVYGRFTPPLSPHAATDAPYARFVYAQSDGKALVRADVSSAEPDRHAHDLVCRSGPLGWTALTRFPHDARLPTLAAAIDTPGEVTIVRYRPGRRCTFRVAGDRGVRYGKVFPDASGASIHDVGVALFDAADRGELGFAVARPLGWDPERRTLWQSAIGGTPVAPLLAGRDATRLAEGMGRAAATLTCSSVRPPAGGAAFDQCARSRSYADELAARVPAIAGRAKALSEALDAVHRARPSRARPIHGAPHINQWLAQAGGTPARGIPPLALVDFDRFAVGDPELDAATFLGELDFEEELAGSRAAIGAAFVDGYEAVAGRLDPALAAAYRAHKRLAKALRSARAVRPDGDMRATVHLARAEEALAHTVTR